MKQLYNSIIKKHKNLVQIEDFYPSLEIIKSKLVSEGYNISKLSDRGIVILFISLVDIIFIIQDNKMTIVTLNQDKIMELHKLQRIITRDDERSYEKTYQILKCNTKDVINQYLLEGKFHFIKLNPYEPCQSYFFLVSISGMNPYPKLDKKELIIPLDSMSNRFNMIYNCLLVDVCKLKLKNGSYKICHNANKKLKSTVTSGYILTNNLDNTIEKIYLWDIVSCEPYSENEFIQALLSGVVDYKGAKITLNKDILFQYYGNKLFTTLESKGVRERYCLEELSGVDYKYDYTYYLKKYNLDIECDSLPSLVLELQKIVDKPEKKNENVVHARVLTSNLEHKSFYMTIDLRKLEDYKVIEDLRKVLPNRYRFYAISKGLGYNFVEVTATSEDLAVKYGKAEFKRQFGDIVYTCNKRTPRVLGINIQRSLCQNIMYGYVENYKGYSPIIKDICKSNNLIEPSDEHIKFLYINQLAKKYKSGSSVVFVDVIKYLLDFMDLLKSTEKADKALTDEYIRISSTKAYKEFIKLSKDFESIEGNSSDYIIDDTPKGKFIETKNARFKILNDKISSKVEIYHNGQYLCTKSFKLK